MKNDAWYRTLRCIDKHGKVSGVITIVTVPSKVASAALGGECFRYGIAYAKAKHFVRKKGQMIAFNRLVAEENLLIKNGKTVKDTIIDKHLDRTISFVHDAVKIV